MSGAPGQIKGLSRRTATDLRARARTEALTTTWGGVMAGNYAVPGIGGVADER